MINRRTTKAVLIILILLFPTLLIIDRVIGYIWNVDNNELSIKSNQYIFKPYSEAIYTTSEFNFEVSINNIGVRDDEINIDKGNKYRILCFGDSWTFGWGVDNDNSWPQLLEKYLRENSLENIEVINCGRPGQYTRKYLEYMSWMVPLLKPDLVLIGVFQLEDLAALYQYNYPLNNKFRLKTLIRKIKTATVILFQFTFKNIFSLSGPVDIKSNWEKTSEKMINDFTHLQQIRFSSFSDTLQTMFSSGNLNPGLVNNYINYPDELLIFNDPNNSATKWAINAMDEDFKKMKEICKINGSDIIFINLPMNIFTGHNVIRGPIDLLNEYFRKSNNIDKIYRSIADSNDIYYIELTNHFINLENKNKYFYRYDGHPNEHGYNEMATYIGQKLLSNRIVD